MRKIFKRSLLFLTALLVTACKTNITRNDVRSAVKTGIDTARAKKHQLC